MQFNFTILLYLHFIALSFNNIPLLMPKNNSNFCTVKFLIFLYILLLL